MLWGEAAKTNFIAFGFNQTGLEPILNNSSSLAKGYDPLLSSPPLAD